MKTHIIRGLAALALVTAFAGAAAAEQQQYRYTCRVGALTISSKSPCYVTMHGISVPGGGGATDKSDKAGKQEGGKEGGGFGGPKDLKDKPKGGGFGGGGPKDVKNKD